MKRLLLIPLFAVATLLAQESPEHKAGEPAGHGSATEHGSEGEIAPIWRWANFGILAIGIGYLMGKYLPPLFDSRSKEIHSGISEAQQLKQDAERRSAEMDARLNSMGSEMERFRTESAAEMQQEGERIGRDTAAQIKRIEQQAAVELESVGKTTRRQLKEYAAELALGIAEQRLRSSIDSAAESTLVDGFVRDLERQASQKTGTNN